MNLLRTLIIACTFFTASVTLGQITQSWHWGIGSTEGDASGKAKMDDSDNIYTIFEIRDTTDINPGSQTELVRPQRGLVNSLIKVNAQGNLVYHHDFYGGIDTYGEVYDLDYNQMVIGFNVIDSLVYERNGVRQVLFKQPGYNACIIRMTLDGNIISLNHFSVPSDFYFSYMAILPDDRLIVSGTFIDTFSFPGMATPLISQGKSDSFIMMLDPQYNVMWTRHFGGPNREGFSTLEMANQKIYYGLTFTGTLYVPSGQSTIPVEFKGQEDFIFGYMDLDGNIQRMIPMGAEGYDNIRSIKADADGNMYICGHFDKTFNFAGLSATPAFHQSWNSHDGFIAKYNAEGELIWTRIYRDSEYGAIYMLHLERGNEIYAAGAFSDTADLNPGTDSLLIEGWQNNQGYITKLSTDGDFQWSYWMSATGIHGIRGLNVSTITGSIYLNGFFTSTINCSQLPEESWLQSAGSSDIFMIGFSEENVITASTTIPITEIAVYPNPTTDHISITTENEITSVALFDMNGRIVKKWDEAEVMKKQLSLQELVPGMYIIQVVANGQQLAKKLFVQ